MEAKPYDPKASHTFKLGEGRTEQTGRKTIAAKKYILTESTGFNIIDLIRQHRYLWILKMFLICVWLK